MWPVVLPMMQAVTHSPAKDAGERIRKLFSLRSSGFHWRRYPHCETVLCIYVTADQFVLGFCFGEADREPDQRSTKTPTNSQCCCEIRGDARQGEARRYPSGMVGGQRLSGWGSGWSRLS